MNTKFLNGTRFLLAFWVFAGHFYSIIGGPSFYKLPLQRIINNPIIAVNGFIMITGFLMMYNYIQRKDIEMPNQTSTIKSFWWRRIFRLYPVYTISILVAFVSFVDIASFKEEILQFFTGTNYTPSGELKSTVQPSIIDLFSHLLLIHGMLPEFHRSILGVAWSLSLEAQFYFLFPFIFLILFKKGKVSIRSLLVFYPLALISSILSKKLFGYWMHPGIISGYHFQLPSFILYLLPLFLLGMLMAAVGLKKLKFRYLCVFIALTIPFQDKLTSLIILFFVVFLYLDFAKSFLNKRIFAILSFLRNVLSNKFSEFGANISYSFYLIHTMIIPPVIKFTITIGSNLSLSPYQIAIAALILSIVICFAVCHLLYTFVEKPFIQIGKTYLKKSNNSRKQTNSQSIA